MAHQNFISGLNSGSSIVDRHVYMVNNRGCKIWEDKFRLEVLDVPLAGQHDDWSDLFECDRDVHLPWLLNLKAFKKWR